MEFEEELRWLKAKRKKRGNKLNQEFHEMGIASSARILEIIDTIISQRASDNCIDRLIKLKQIIIDRSYRNPEIERRVVARRA